MISAQQLVTFAIASFIIIVIPGPSVLFVISRGVALGRRAALATVVGNTAGAGTQGLFVVFGLGAIVTKSIAAYNVIKFVGAFYLMYLGWNAFRNRHSLAFDEDSMGANTSAGAGTGPGTGLAATKSTKQIMKEGFVVGFTNPKIIVFFSATLPQFIDRDRGSVSAQMLILLLTFETIGLLSDGAWGLLAGSVRGWFSQSPKRLETLVGAGGLAIIGLGVRLAFSSRQH